MSLWRVNNFVKQSIYFNGHFKKFYIVCVSWEDVKAKRIKNVVPICTELTNEK
jgi:hypothetical protein